MSFIFPGIATTLLENRTAYYVGFIVGALFLVLQVFQGKWGLFDFAVPSVQVPSTHEIYPALLEWTSGRFNNVRKLRAMPNNSERRGGPRGNELHDHRGRYKLSYEPFSARVWFFRRHYYFYLHRTESTEEENISLGVLYWSSEPIKILLQEIRDADCKEGARETTIYYPFNTNRVPGFWREFLRKTSRPWESVVLDEKKKQSVLDALDHFLHPDTEKRHVERGIPYHLGLLFYGPPGTGKTSLAQAIAAYYGLPIYVMPLADCDITDTTFPMFMRTLPKRCVLLFEDIDSAGLISNEEAKSRKRTDPAQSEGLTRTGFINGIDGIVSPHGYIYIMTTNHRDKLDAAMTRAGRVDLTLEIPLASKDNARQMFTRMYSNHTEINAMADLFADAIPENVHSAADLQGFLMSIEDPAQATRNVREWAEAKMKAKEDN